MSYWEQTVKLTNGQFYLIAGLLLFGYAIQCAYMFVVFFKVVRTKK